MVSVGNGTLDEKEIKASKKAFMDYITLFTQRVSGMKFALERLVHQMGKDEVQGKEIKECDIWQRKLSLP